MKPISSPLVVSVAISWILVAPAFSASPQLSQTQPPPNVRKERKVSTNEIPAVKEIQHGGCTDEGGCELWARDQIT